MCIRLIIRGPASGAVDKSVERWSVTRHGMPAAVLIAILTLGGCSEIPPPVTATKLFAVSGVTEVLNAVALSPDGALVVVADMDGQIIARDRSIGRRALEGPRAGAGRAPRIDTLAFSGDGTFLVSAGDDARVTELWKARHRIRSGHGGRPQRPYRRVPSDGAHAGSWAAAGRSTSWMSRGARLRAQFPTRTWAI